MRDRAALDPDRATALDDAAGRAAARRARNIAAGRCLNDNADGTHGAATDGVRCAHCAAVHRGDAIVPPLARKALCQCANCRWHRQGKRRLEHPS